MTATATATATATPPPPSQVDPVVFSDYQTTSVRPVHVTLSTDTPGTTIFYTISDTPQAANPTHDGPTPTGGTFAYTGPITVGPGATRWFKAMGYKAGMSDSILTEYGVDNSGNIPDPENPIQEEISAGSAGSVGSVGSAGYDANGNLKSYKGRTYTYDAQNRLTSASNNGTQIASFRYDGKNRQIARNINGVIRINVWDGWELIEEYASGTLRAAAYLQGTTGVIKSWTYSNVLYYYQDKLGSTTHVANPSGALLETYRYDLYGTPSYYRNNVKQDSSLYGINDLYAGERWIGELGLYDLRNRFMSPELGRFLQTDPIGFKGDASNLYRYCHNDPADFSDPMGLQDPSNPIRLTSWGRGDWDFDNGRVALAQINLRQQQPAGNDNRIFYGDVRGYAERRQFRGIDPVGAGHAVAGDATQAAEAVAKDIRKDDKGYWGVERGAAEYASGGRLHKSPKLELGPAYRYNPSVYLPDPPNGLPRKALFSGSHGHGPQSGRTLEFGDVPSANGNNKVGVPYISAVARSTDPGRVSVYVPTSGRYYHTNDGGDSYYLGK
jgi:RHS repeat-associated protein